MNPTFMIAIPLLTAFLLLVLPKKRWLTTLLITLVALFTSVYSISMLFNIEKSMSFGMGGWPPPFGINLVVDNLSALFVMVTQLSFLLTVFALFGWYHAERYSGALMMTFLAAVNGMILTGDLFNLFVFMEIASVSLFALLNLRESSGSLKATFNYMVLNALASSVYLIGIALVYRATGTLNMADLSQKWGVIPEASATAVFLMLLTPLLLKAEIFPLNLWAPRIYGRSSAGITTLLAGMIAPAGFYSMIRLISLLSASGTTQDTLLILAVLTMVIGEVVALTRKSLREMLGFSSVAGMGVLLMAALSNAMEGALFHLFNLALAKVVMFLSVELLTAGGRDDLESLKGTYRRNPAMAFVFASGAFSVAGLPLFAGFRSKLIILSGMMRAEHYIITAVFIFASIVEFFYYTRAVQHIFSPNEEVAGGRQCSHPLATLILLAAAIFIIFTGIYPEPVIALAEKAQMALTDVGTYVASVLGGM